MNAHTIHVNPPTPTCTLIAFKLYIYSEKFTIEEGEYKINVVFDDQHVPGSPFTALISDEFDASKVMMRTVGTHGKSGMMRST